MTKFGQWLKSSTFAVAGASLVAGATLLMPVAAHADGGRDGGWSGSHSGDDKPCVARSADGRGKTVPAGTEIIEDGPGGSTIHLVCDGTTGEWVKILDVTAGNKILRTPSAIIPKLEPQVYDMPH